jgi:hypothetical protein
LKPIKVAQQFKFIPFEQFTTLLDTLDTWIFSSSTKIEDDHDMSIKQEDDNADDSTNRQRKNRWYASGESWTNNKEIEPSAVSFQHGLLCSASLCQGILHKLQTMV